MNWLQRYHAWHYLRNALWPLPVASIVVALVAARLLHGLDVALGWEMAITPDTARAVLGTLAASMFTFIVFVCSALLVAVQLASAQLTPRVIVLVFNDRGTRWALTLFVFTFTFTLGVLVRIEKTVPFLTTQLAAYGSLLSLAAFLYLIDHVGKALRPTGAVRRVALLGREVIEAVYPRQLSATSEAEGGQAELPAGTPVVVPSDVDGSVLAFDVGGLMALARDADCVVEMVPQVGDFVAVGDPLFRVYGGKVSADALRQSVAVGLERTLEQDPAFVFRILVDIASKGLSPGINDPTTAVHAIDQVHHLLKNLGGRYLDNGLVRDAAGRLRLVYRTPDWEDFVLLAVTEIRHFGRGSIQIARRLRAMLENLLQAVPEGRAVLLRQELSLIHRSAEHAFPDPEDRALAGVSDLQGVGGTSGGQPR
jgi:uncharacterized membrane protein